MHTETQSAALQVMPGTASAGTLLMNDSSMDKLERLADLMASGRATVPQHLKGSKGDCFAICLQSMQWGMNPFAVAQKTHLINGTLGYGKWTGDIPKFIKPRAWSIDSLPGSGLLRIFSSSHLTCGFDLSSFELYSEQV